VNDLRQALRLVAARPTWPIVVMVSLALGIAANTIVFSVVDAVLLRPLPYRDAGQVVFMWASQDTTRRLGLSGSDIAFFQDNAESLSGLAPFLPGETVAIGIDGSDAVGRSYVGSDVFDVLGVAPAQGRSFRVDDDQEGAPPVMVVSYGFWRSRLGGDPGALGRTVRVEGELREVIGIMPQGFFFPDHGVQLWANLSTIATRLSLGDMTAPAVGRLAPGVSVAHARAELATLSVRRGPESPVSFSTGAGVFPVRDIMLGEYRLALWILFGAVGVLLLIACANVANLLLGRGLEREQEFAVRASLGASQLVLARQMLTESLVLAGGAGAVSMVLAFWGIRLVRSLGLVDIPRIEEATLDMRVLGFALGASLCSALLFGLLPALRSSRVDLGLSLKSSGHTTAGSDRGTLRELLLVAQIALALVLLIGAGLLVRSFTALRAFDWGFEPAGAVAIVVRVPDALRRADYVSKVDFASRALDALMAAPGVRSASVSNIAPLAEFSATSGFRFAVNRQLTGESAHHYHVTPGYFETLGTLVLEGRDFGANRGNGLPEVVLGEALAARLFPGGAVGQTLEAVVTRPEAEARLGTLSRAERVRVLDDPDNLEFRPYTVVGVVQDVHMYDFDLDLSAVYTDMRQGFLLRGSALHERLFMPNRFILRTDRDIAPVVAAAGAALLRTEPGLTLDRIVPLEEAASRAVGGAGTNRLLVAVSTTFSTLALLLASVGIYGVMSQLVARRTNEIGVRMALGANRAAVVLLVLRRSLRLTVLGLALGLTCAWAVTRLLESLLFTVSPTEPAVFAGVAVLFLMVALAASAVPARSASRVDPLLATRAL
jgi:predicted permease